MKRIMLLLILFNPALGNATSLEVADFDMKYVNERVKAHTVTFNSKTDADKIPKGVMLRHAFSNLSLDSDLRSLKANNKNDKAEMKEAISEDDGFKSKKATKTLALMCETVQAQSNNNTPDAYKLALLANRAEQEEYDDLDIFFSNKMESLTDEYATKLQEVLNSDSNNITLSRTNWVALSLELPDVVYTLIKQGCVKQTTSNLLAR